MTRTQNYLSITDYQNWTAGLYLIDAPCGSGKSSFIFRTLYPYAHENGKRILLFSNRLALKEQQEYQAVGTDIACMTYQKLEYNSYLNGLWTVQNSVPDLMSLVEQEFDYLVLDEAHYMFQDSSFNLNTDIILNMIERCCKQKIIILLSATADLLKKYFATKITKIYSAQADYSYIDSVYCYNRKDTILKIIDSIPPDEKIMVFGNNKDRLQKLNHRYLNSEYLSGDNKAISPVFRQIVEQESFGCRILFTTKVLDNGVNLKDRAIKHIIIEQTDMVEFIQCLGRKRIIDKDDTINLYFYDSFQNITGLYGQLVPQMEIAQEYYQFKENNQVDYFRERYLRKRLPDFFDNQSNLIFPTYYKAHEDYMFYRAIVNKVTSLHQQVAIALQKNIIHYEEAERHYSLLTYLSQNVGRRYFKQDRNELVEMFNIRDSYRLQKSIGVLNQYLIENNIGYELQSVRAGRNEGRETYWIIVQRRI